MQRFGEKLRVLRKRHGMTIIELAAALGYTANSYVSELETGNVPSNLMRRFGEKLRVLRKQQGMTVRDLAQALGYRNHGYVSLIETGKITPRVEFVLKVANLFQVTMDQLTRDDVELDDTAGSA
jgi:transcriptional regulator with XRE-family HTH domain